MDNHHGNMTRSTVKSNYCLQGGYTRVSRITWVYNYCGTSNVTMVIVHALWYKYIYIYSILISKVPTVLYFPYSTLFTTSGLYIFQMLFTTLENNALTSGLVKEHQVLHSSSLSLATSINSNYMYYKPDKTPVLLVLYWNIYISRTALAPVLYLIHIFIYLYIYI